MLTIAAVAGCKCDGNNQIRSVDGIRISPDKDSVKYEAVPGDTFTLLFKTGDEISRREGKRKCKNKDFVISYENTWDTTGFRLYCNRSIIAGSDTILPYQNILHHKGISNEFMAYRDFAEMFRVFQYTVVRFPKGPMLNTTYTFTLEGRRSDNVRLKDSCDVYVY